MSDTKTECWQYKQEFKKQQFKQYIQKTTILAFCRCYRSHHHRMDGHHDDNTLSGIKLEDSQEFKKQQF